jgi:hypothetical protein
MPQRQIDRAVIQAGLNAILGPGHPACEKWIKITKEMEAECPDSTGDDVWLFEHMLHHAYIEQLPHKSRIEMGLRIIGDAHGIDIDIDY